MSFTSKAVFFIKILFSLRWHFSFMLDQYFAWIFGLFRGLFYFSYFSCFGAFLFRLWNILSKEGIEYVLKYFYDCNVIQIIISTCAEIALKFFFLPPVKCFVNHMLWCVLYYISPQHLYCQR